MEMSDNDGKRHSELFLWGRRHRGAMKQICRVSTIPGDGRVCAAIDYCKTRITLARGGVRF